MDERVAILRSYLSKMSDRSKDIMRAISVLLDTNDMDLKFEDISRRVTENRRLSLRATQCAAEISQISREVPFSGSDSEYNAMKKSLLYNGVFNKYLVGNIINPISVSEGDVYASLSAEFTNNGVAFDWSSETETEPPFGVCCFFECNKDGASALQRSFVSGEGIQYGDTYTFEFDGTEFSVFLESAGSVAMEFCLCYVAEELAAEADEASSINDIKSIEGIVIISDVVKTLNVSEV